MVRLWLPDPVTPVPVAVSTPKLSVSVVVIVSEAETASASAMLTPAMAVETLCGTVWAPGTVITGWALVVVAIVSGVATPPRLSPALTVMVSAAVELLSSVRVARSAFTASTVPVTVRWVVPDPVTPEPPANSKPFVSTRFTVTVWPAVNGSVSVTLTPAIGVPRPCCTSCAPGTVRIGGEPLLVAPIRKSWPKSVLVVLDFTSSVTFTARFVDDAMLPEPMAPRSSAWSLKKVVALARSLNDCVRTVVPPTVTVKVAEENPVPSDWVSSRPTIRSPDRLVGVDVEIDPSSDSPACRSRRWHRTRPGSLRRIPSHSPRRTPRRHWCGC